MTSLRRVDFITINILDGVGERLHVGSAERYIRDLAHLCARMRLAPRILQVSSVPFERRVDGIDVVGIPSSPGAGLAQLSRQFASAVADATLVIASPLDLACALPPGPTVIGINHGGWLDDSASPHGDQQVTMERMASALARVEVVVAADSNFTNWLRAGRIYRPSQVRYIPNFVALDRFDVGGGKDFDARLRVMFPRRLCAERGLPTLLTALDTVLAERAAIDLTICGAGDAKSETATRAFIDRWPGRVTWIQRTMDEMPAAYAASHVVVISTVYSERASLSCLEAMASNNAVVATDVGGLASLVIDGFNGLLIETGVEPLMAAVLRLADDRAYASRLAQRAMAVSASFGQARWERAWHATLLGALAPHVRRQLAISAERSDDPAPRAVDVPTLLGALGQDALGAALAATEARHRAFVQVQQQLEEARKELELAQPALDTLRARCAAAERDADGGRQRINEMAAEREAARVQHELVQQQLVLQIEMNAQLQARQQSMSTAMTEVTAREAQLAAQLQAATAQADALRQSLADAEAARLDEEARLHAQTQTLSAELQQSGQREAHLRGWMTELDHKLASATQQAERADGDATALREFYEARRRSFKMLGVDALYEVFRRAPSLHRLARNSLPKAMRARVYGRSVANTMPHAQAALPNIGQPLIWQEPVRSFLSYRLLAPARDARAYLARGAAAVKEAGARARDLARKGWMTARTEGWSRAAAMSYVKARRAMSRGTVAAAVFSGQLESLLARHPGRRVAVLLPVMDWDVPLFQRPQHMARALAAHGYLYFYCVPGSRDGVHGFREIADGVVLTDQLDLLRALPAQRLWHVYSTDLMHDIAQIRASMHRGDRILYDYIDELDDVVARRSIPPFVRQRHRDLLTDERTCVSCTSDRLADEVRALRTGNFSVVTNGVDCAHFSVRRGDVPAPLALRGLLAQQRPIIGYFGALASWIDYDLLRELAQRRPDVDIVLIGSAYDDAVDAVDWTVMPNVHKIGAVPYAELPRWACWFDVGIIPFRICPITESTSPLKLFEYMALGIPIVSTDTRECRKYSSVLIGQDADSFITQVGRAIQLRDDGGHRETLAREAAENDWIRKGGQVAALLDAAAIAEADA